MRCDQVFEGLVGFLQEYQMKSTPGSSVELLKPMLRYFYLHSELIELLITANRIDIVQESFRRLMEPFKSMHGAFYGVEEQYVEYIIAIRIGAITNILTQWIETGKRQAPDELADKISAMISSEKSPWASI
jgi:hypothetical protein